MKKSSKNREFINFISFISILAFFFIFIVFLITNNYFSYAYLKNQVNNFGFFSPVIFIIIFAFGTVAFIPATILSIASGILFGTTLGTIYSIIGATIGAGIAFFIAKILGKPYIESVIDTKLIKLKQLSSHIEKKGFKSTLILRIIPIIPFTSINYALGLTKIRFDQYIIATFIGLIPSTILYAYFGESIILFNIKNMFISLALLITLIFIYPIIKKIRKTKKK